MRTPAYALLSMLLLAGPARATDAPETYSLARDVAARQVEARRELGARAAVEVVGGVFVFAAPRAAGTAGAASIAKRALAAYFNGRFDARPERAISVYLFPAAAPYQAWCRAHDGARCDSPYGFYEPGDRRIVMNAGLGIGTLTHELVHPLVEADFPAAPDWLDEGIASLFERPVLPKPGEIHGVTNWRRPRLVRALASKTEHDAALPSALFGMSDASFRGDGEDLHYATARYLCQWLDARGQLWAFYHRYRDHAADDPTGEQAFVAVVKKTPRAIDGDWVRWVRALQ